MCLSIKKSEHLIKRNNFFTRLFKNKKNFTLFANKADEDIHTLKYLIVGKNEDNIIYIAPYRRTTYILKEKYHLDNWNKSYDSKYYDDYAYINEGFHSLTSDTHIFTENSDTKWVLCDCIIPEGSYYYIGDNDDIVSDTIIINEIKYESDGEYENLSQAPIDNNGNRRSNKKKRKRKRKLRRK